ncbi:MAG: hypothetical protein ACETWT_06000 [Thermodesulfobacteriota bacterium]
MTLNIVNLVTLQDFRCIMGCRYSGVINAQVFLMGFTGVKSIVQWGNSTY